MCYEANACCTKNVYPITIYIICTSYIIYIYIIHNMYSIYLGYTYNIGTLFVQEVYFQKFENLDIIFL